MSKAKTKPATLPDRPTVEWLSARVICVAESRSGAWLARIYAGFGMCAIYDCRTHGSQLAEPIARAIFPQFDGPYAA